MDIGVSGVYYGITNREKEDQKLIVQFSLVPVVDPAETELSGAPVWVNREYITIHSPGDSTNIPHRPVEPKDRIRFRERYERWKKAHGAALEGQPLTAWPGATPADVNMLANAGVHTVEALAALGDNQVGKEGGPVAYLRDKAKRYLEAAKSNAPVEILNRKLAEKDGQIGTLQEQVAAMSSQLTALMARLASSPPNNLASEPPRRRPGRPPKHKPPEAAAAG